MILDVAAAVWCIQSVTMGGAMALLLVEWDDTKNDDCHGR
jgi:hypothetical protein